MFMTGYTSIIDRVPRSPLKTTPGVKHPQNHFLTKILQNKIVGIKNVPCKISYKVGHPRISLDLPFNLEIH